MIGGVVKSAVTTLNEVVAPLIDGALAKSESDATVDVVDPSNGQRSFLIPRGSDADANRAVMSARRAFEHGGWSEAPPSFIKKVLHRLADLIDRDAPTLDALDAGEMGKPVSETLANAKEAARFTRFCAEAVDKVTGDVYESDKHSFVVQRRVPRGVVAAIVPWNFPTFNAVLKLGPALAARNSMVLKPSELSSRSAMRLGSLALEAGLPPGVLNIVPGIGETVGRALGLHSDVDMLTFTGSSDVGKLMLQYAGQSNMKVVMAECGGKSPQIVFDDGIDLDAASESIARLLLANQGQLCSVGSRLLVQRSIEATMLEKIGARFSQIVMGDARDPNTTYGPLASSKQYARVMRHIEIAQADGAQLVTGGRRALEETGGYFVEPTVFREVSPAARVAQEEIFGPVLAIIPFEDEAEAIRIANGTMYGLAAYVWTTKLATGMKLARSIRSPVTINSVATASEGAAHAAAWEPARQSGIGTEGGLAGIESYLRRQVVWFNHG